MLQLVAELKQIPVSQLTAHPDNPRLIVRDDVVESICRQINGSGIQSEHALLVRPVNGSMQIVSGHHRAEAARRAKLETVPCWVREMDDESAFMQLVLANAQGELSALEIGVHAFKAVKKSQGISGAGFEAYAKQIGKSRPYVSQVSSAAEVFGSVKENFVSQLTKLMDKSQHLYAIHHAHCLTWPLLVEFMLEREWTVKDTEHWVEKVKTFEIPLAWEHSFLPYLLVIQRFLKTKEFSARTVKSLCALANATLAMLDEEEGEASDDERKNYLTWLTENVCGSSWDVRKLEVQHKEIRERLDKEKAARESAWLLGNWRERLGALEDGSVSLLLTDPPYGKDFQSDYKLDRREERRHDVIAADGKIADAVDELAAMLTAVVSKLATDSHVLIFSDPLNERYFMPAIESAGLKIRGSLIWKKNNTGMGDPTTTFAPIHERIIHAVKGSPTLFKREPDVLEADRIQSAIHPTEKPVDLLQRLIEATTVTEQLVIDPFGGVASTLVAARNAKRRFWGCEIEAKYHEAGVKRLAK